MTEYLSVADSIKANGDKHKANGDKYYSDGLYNYAIGSYLKALRNWNTYLDFKEFENGLPTFVQPLIDRVSANMANAIMYGVSIEFDGKIIDPKDFYK